VEEASGRLTAASVAVGVWVVVEVWVGAVVAKTAGVKGNDTGPNNRNSASKTVTSVAGANRA
jgi:hypothetical protein